MRLAVLHDIVPLVRLRARLAKPNCSASTKGSPTLVVHGTEDPILSYSHGAATADAIPGARLLTLEDVGHDLPRRVNDRVIGAILEHSGS